MFGIDPYDGHPNLYTKKKRKRTAAIYHFSGPCRTISVDRSMAAASSSPTMR